jgi:hypothetical protein
MSSIFLKNKASREQEEAGKTDIISVKCRFGGKNPPEGRKI